MQTEELLVEEAGDPIVFVAIPLRSCHSQCSRKTDHLIAQRSAFHRPRVADQVEIRACFPAFSLETLSTHFGRNRWVRACIAIGKNRIIVFVERYVRGVGCGCWSGSGFRIFCFSSAAAADENGESQR